ncbi:complement C5-like [Nannospalax galili]|uniref:complement C5-like n=1 Tax=Nannospalax galili TaxID=1026970 RepID=UPI00111C6158|nr:complement C5-like [Nannospalax galili]
MGFWEILCFIIFLEKSWGQEQRYSISVPEVFRVEASENITIQAHGYTEAFDVTVSIKSYPDKKSNYSLGSVNLSPENKFQNSVNLTIQPKQLSEGENTTSYVYLEIVSKYFSKLETISVTYDNGSVSNHTDKSVYMSQLSDEGYKKTVSSRLYETTRLQHEIEKIVAKYRHPVVKKCCYDGARRNDDETCEERVARVTIGPHCARAFSECCVIANQLRFYKRKTLQLES